MTETPKFSSKMVWDKTHWIVRLSQGDKLVSENTLTQGVEITSAAQKPVLKVVKTRQAAPARQR